MNFDEIYYGVYHNQLNVYLDYNGYHYSINNTDYYGWDSQDTAIRTLKHLISTHGFNPKSLAIHKLSKRIVVNQIYEASEYVQNT